MINKETLLREYFENEKTYAQIAKEQHCAESHVCVSMKKHGLMSRYHKGVPLTKELLFQLYTIEKRTICQIAKETNWSPSKIKNNLRNFKIPIRSGKKQLKINHAGNKVGLLTVKEHMCGKGWLCLCDCGKETIVRSSELNRGRTRPISCGCSQYLSGEKHGGWKGVGELSGAKFNSYRSGAKSRNLDFEISTEYIWELFLSQNRICALSGALLTMNETASLDRIDSTKGYVEGNVQWVHKEINLMKWDLMESVFINWCHQVSANNPRP